MSVVRLTLCAVLLSSCVPEIKQETPPVASGGTVARFSPNATDPCLSTLPFPSDLAKSQSTGLLELPYCTTDDAQTIAMKSGLRTLDGYSLGTAIYTTLSGPVSADSLAEHVLLINTRTQAPVATTFVSSTAAGAAPLYIIPALPLEEATTYIAVLTTDVKDDGGKPIVADQVFTFVRSAEPLIDDLGYSRFPAVSDADANALEPLRQGFRPMFDSLAALGMPREKIAVAWSFTTQSVSEPLAVLHAEVATTDADVAYENAIPAAAHPLLHAAGAPVAHLCTVYSGHVGLQSVVSSRGTVDPHGPSATTADYILVTPRDSEGNCTETWSKVALFVHGLGRCKNDVFGIANSLAAAGYATLSLDGPRAGARSVASLGDSDLDGCPDQGATPELVALKGESPNPFVIRDLLREWAVELTQVASAAHVDPWAFGGLDTPADATPIEVALVGHSFGGMAAVLAASVSDDVDALVVNATSGELGAVFQPGIAANLAAAGVDTGTAAGQAALAQAVATFRWALEPADGIYAGLPATLPVLAQVVDAGGDANIAPLHATSTQALLATALGQTLTSVTFDLTSDGGTTSVCTDVTSAVGSLLKPCAAEDAPAYLVALGATGGMQRQVATFLGSGGLLLCDPNITVACP